MASKNRYLCFDREGLVYVLNSKDFAVSRKIYIGRQDEHLKVIKAVNWIRQIDKTWTPDVILDIGANIGHISIPLVKNRIFKKALGFEPEKENYKLYWSNVILNELEEKIDTYNIAIGASNNKILALELSEDNFGDHRVRVSEGDGAFNESKRSVVKIYSRTLDSFKKDICCLRPLLCIDIQGFEGAALKGSKRILEQKPPICIEFWPYGMNRANTFDDFFKALLPYKFYYDLNESKPIQNKIKDLKFLFEKYKDIDSFYFDILVFSKKK